MTWLIRFDYPEGVTAWAGWAGNGTLGWALTPSTAAEFESREIATETLRANFPKTEKYATVIEGVAE